MYTGVRTFMEQIIGRALTSSHHSNRCYAAILIGNIKVTGYLELCDFIYVYIYATETGTLKS